MINKLHHFIHQETGSYIVPIPKLFSAGVNIAVSIIPGVISMPFFNSSIDVLFGAAKFMPDESIVTCAHLTVPGIFLCPHFQISHKLK